MNLDGNVTLQSTLIIAVAAFVVGAIFAYLATKSHLRRKRVDALLVTAHSWLAHEGNALRVDNKSKQVSARHGTDVIKLPPQVRSSGTVGPENFAGFTGDDLQGVMKRIGRDKKYQAIAWPPEDPTCIDYMVRPEYAAHH